MGKETGMKRRALGFCGVDCAGGRGIKTCADCPEYACGKWTAKWGELPAGPKARENLPRRGLTVGGTTR